MAQSRGGVARAPRYEAVSLSSFSAYARIQYIEGVHGHPLLNLLLSIK